MAIGARYLIPRGPVVYFGELQLAFASMRSNDVAFEGDGRSVVPGPELSIGVAYALNSDASIAAMVGGGVELLATTDGRESEPYAAIQFAVIAHFGDD